MTSTLVCDASAIVAALLDAGRDGRWASEAIANSRVAAPGLMPFEAANIIRRHQLSEAVTADQAAQAHADLVDLPVDLWPYDLLARRAWELRRNLPTYDAAYVAVAEVLAVPLVTLDRRIGRVPGLRCDVLVP